MASLLPAIPTDWRPSYDDICCRRVSTDVRDSGRRWGADKREYGGMGLAADQVIQRGGVASRSHRHYGSGILNRSAQMQPYQITDLLLSDSRPCDQLLPPPLLTNQINHHRQLCEYPGNHTYTSHRSKFVVFPLADQSTSSKLSPLTRGTTEVLQQIHHHQFCTTTYQQTYTNPWTRRLAELHSNPTSRAEISSGVTDEGDKNKGERFKECCEVKNGKNDPKLCLEEGSEQRSQDVSTGESYLDICKVKPGGVVEAGERNHDDGGSWDKEVAVKKRVHWQDKEGENEGEGESSRDESPEQAERGEEEVQEKEVEAERGSEGMEDTCHTEKELTTGKELLDEEEKERQKESVATSLPQLPIHFRRVSSKYCRNQLSPIWPCSIPYYLTRPHSMLHQSPIPRPTVKFAGEESSYNYSQHWGIRVLSTL
ncbi:hypothetical protein GBAR_LOCUS18170 [Geodia barretti]|uniref:Uncharacterized protein n=1 Tax=Geodia barretti TaxID=519541 RepID=A0AA35SMC5_GEOBA|nr:hypothetical protein GBAR_LOCUS18170 [Geodia barretti]